MNQNDLLLQIYSRPQTGGEIPYFVGNQYGAGWLKSIGRFAFPILKKILGVATNTAKDVIVDDKPFLSSLTNPTVKEVNKTINKKRKRNNVLPVFSKRKRYGMR